MYTHIHTRAHTHKQTNKIFQNWNHEKVIFSYALFLEL